MTAPPLALLPLAVLAVSSLTVAAALCLILARPRPTAEPHRQETDTDATPPRPERGSSGARRPLGADPRRMAQPTAAPRYADPAEVRGLDLTGAARTDRRDRPARPKVVSRPPCPRCHRRARGLGYCSPVCSEADRAEQPDRWRATITGRITQKLARAAQLDREGRTAGAEALRGVARRWQTLLDTHPPTDRQETR